MRVPTPDRIQPPRRRPGAEKTKLRGTGDCVRLTGSLSEVNRQKAACYPLFGGMLVLGIPSYSTSRRAASRSSIRSWTSGSTTARSGSKDDRMVTVAVSPAAMLAVTRASR